MENFRFPGQTGFYGGKVRDVYSIGTDKLVMIASDRISAFDVILPRPIPFKGTVLNLLAAEMLRATNDICPNWLRDVPAPQVSVGARCEPIKVEVVVRGTLTGHAWRTYAEGKRVLCGAEMPDGLREHDFFPAPIITPSTKADAGHDEDISPAEIIKKGICSEAEWTTVTDYAHKLYRKGSEMAAQRGLILADTKYEFGRLNGGICLMDEIHTPDSSRYFFAEGFDERQAAGEKQQQLSKEFVREWLMANGFMGRVGEQVPEMTDEKVAEISDRYIELYETLTSGKFDRTTLTQDQVFNAVINSPALN